MANIVFINRRGIGSHLSVINGLLGVTPGVANAEQQWQLNFVPGGAANVFTIQHVTDGRFIQIQQGAVNLVANPVDNCQLTLDNGIGNNTTITNNNLEQPVSMQVVGNAIQPIQGGGGEAWNVVAV